MSLDTFIIKGLNGNLGLLLIFLNSSYVLKIFPVEFHPHLKFCKFPLNLFLSVKAVANETAAECLKDILWARRCSPGAGHWQPVLLTKLHVLSVAAVCAQRS